jgi:hypothetical protein
MFQDTHPSPTRYREVVLPSWHRELSEWAGPAGRAAHLLCLLLAGINIRPCHAKSLVANSLAQH